MRFIDAEFKNAVTIEHLEGAASIFMIRLSFVEIIIPNSTFPSFSARTIEQATLPATQIDVLQWNSPVLQEKCSF